MDINHSTEIIFAINRRKKIARIDSLHFGYVAVQMLVLFLLRWKLLCFCCCATEKCTWHCKTTKERFPSPLGGRGCLFLRPRSRSRRYCRTNLLNNVLSNIAGQ
jgi:hypothetical protein